MSLFLVGLLLLRYITHYGPVVLVVVGLTSAAAMTTSLTHRVRHARGVHSISQETSRAPVLSVLLLGGSVCLLGLCALYIIVVRG